MTAQKKAEAYIRTKCPELMELSFGCEVKFDHDLKGDGSSDSWKTLQGIVLGNGFYGTSIEVKTEMLISDDWKNVTVDVPKSYITKIIGHPIQLQHWLRVVTDVVEWPTLTNWSRTMVMLDILGKEIAFNLTTGQPATEADYQAFNDIVGI